VKRSPPAAGAPEATGPAPVPLGYLEEKLATLEAEGLLRSRSAPVERVGRTFCSNDYLGLASDPGPIAECGAGASRLIVGDRAEHRALETALAGWLGAPAALVFSSGYAANVGTIAALAERGDLIVSDELNHASIIDGCRLSRANVAVVEHLSATAVDRALDQPRSGRAWVLTESYFSMDADTPDLPELRRICDRHRAALVVDEAHALGVFGPGGRGLCADRGVRADVLVGTLGKAFGAAGAFVAGSAALSAWLWNRARSFVFSTAMSPATAAAALRSLGVVLEDEPRRARLHDNAARLRSGLVRLGLSPRGHGPIVPLIMGDPHRAVRTAEVLRGEGIHVQAVRPPTVPVRTSRLRITTTSAHSTGDIDRALDAIARTLPWPAPSF
jgi:8-amino-7-oxononanoate synthase